MKLIIGNKNYSSWSLRPWLLLSHHNIPFEEVRISLHVASTQSEIAPYSGAGKVPVLHDGELVVWDSLAICEYVSERRLSGNGWPSDSRARAEARSFCAEMHSGFFELRAKLPMNCRATGRNVPTTPALDKEIARIDRMWCQLRQKHSGDGPWLFGDFSIADCMFAPVASRFQTYGISLSEEAALYRDQVLGSEAMKQWVAQAKEEVETIPDEEVGAT